MVKDSNLNHNNVSEEQNVHKMISDLKTRSPKEVIDEQLTFGQRSANKTVNIIGSWHFVLSFIAFMVFWIILNTYVLITNPIDKPPYQCLNLLLSCLAGLQSSIILIAQKLKDKKDSIRAENAYKATLKNEMYLEHIHLKIDKLTLLVQSQQKSNNKDGE